MCRGPYSNMCFPWVRPWQLCRALVSCSRPPIFDVLTFHVIALLEPTWHVESYLKCHDEPAGCRNYMARLTEQSAPL